MDFNMIAGNEPWQMEDPTRMSLIRVDDHDIYVQAAKESDFSITEIWFSPAADPDKEWIHCNRLRETWPFWDRVREIQDEKTYL